jgi:hypothetical protein
MIVWGSGGDVINLGEVETRRCDTCERDRPFNLTLRYRYAHLYYLFGWVTEKKYLFICDICNRGWELDTQKIEANLKSVPIPFVRRYGGLVGLAVVACLIVFIMITGK